MKTSDSTPDRLRQVARRLFADHGYAGTSVRAITTRAKANLGAITYHFGSKEALYQEILISLVEPMATAIIRECTVPGPALERVGAVVAVLYRYLHQHPDLPRFMLQVLAEQGPLPRRLAELQGRQRAAVVTLIERGQKEGDIRPGPAPVLLISIISPPVFFGLARRVVTQIGGINPDDPMVVELALRHASAIIRQGLAPDPQGGIPV
jgi:AcrR family transcriptional regulator